MIIILITLLIGSCKHAGETGTLVDSDINEFEVEASSRISQADKEYNFNSPDFTFVLDRNLREISGLSYDLSDNTLLAVDDESGYYYHLSSIDGKEIKKIKFHKKGDYEAIAYVASNVMLAKSSGNIYVKRPNTKKAEIWKNKLNRDNDIEGLAYISDSKSLLIACKGKTIKETTEKSIKEIYRYSLEDSLLIEQPFLTISIAELKRFITDGSPHQSKISLNKKVNRIKNFAPSGIAIHPKSKDVYIVSARSSSLVVYSRDLKLKDIVLLNTKTIPQPEGICFDNKNNLYISTEGQSMSGKIFKFLSKSKL